MVIENAELFLKPNWASKKIKEGSFERKAKCFRKNNWWEV